MVLNPVNPLRIWKLFAVFVLCLATNFGYSQTDCAGLDAEITICNYTDPANQNIDLFSLLGGSPTPGGTWSDPLLTGALNTTTGILNLWGVHNSGTFLFNYTVNSGGCNDSANVMITIGGYSGVANADNTACSVGPPVNLFQYFIANNPNPHQNGQWTDDSGTGALTGSLFAASQAGPGTYNFTYSIPAVGTCPAVSTTMAVTVYRGPFSGLKQDLLFCNTDDFSTFTNVNLFDLLTGEDANGQWTEGTTNELSGPSDTFINVQNIFDTYGVGTYSFTYTVNPPHPVCLPMSTTVKVIIERFLDLTGSILTINSDICEDQIETATYTAVLTPGPNPLPNGQYSITYVIDGPQYTSVNRNVNYNNGFSFPLNPLHIPLVGTYTVTIASIKRTTDQGGCDNIANISDDLHVYPLPDIDDATFGIVPVCQGMDGEFSISGDTNIGTGTYQITYNLTGANTAVAEVMTISSMNGVATFTVAAALLQNPGATTIEITNIVNVTTTCSMATSLTKDFLVNATSITNLTASAIDACMGFPAMISLSGFGAVESILITYDLSGANIASAQIMPAVVIGGVATFGIPADQLPNIGNTVITIINITNSATLCESTINFADAAFTVNPLTPAPDASNTVFCTAFNATVADLIPQGSQYQWYNSASSSTPLDPTFLLVSGIYYVEEILPSALCPSERTAITVLITDLEAPELAENATLFCAADNPTLQDLSENTQADDVLAWFDAPSNGTQLPPSTPLAEGVTYYGINYLPDSTCESEVLAVTITLNNCPSDLIDLFIPDGFSPNGDGVNDVFRIPNIQSNFPDYELEIYNRYGNLMYTVTRAKPEWDGKSSQTQNLIDGMAANGVYFYVLHYNKDGRSPKQGQLYLNR